MKTMIALLLLVSGFAHARDFDCENRVSSTRTEFARISTWPHLVIGTYYTDCSGGACIKGPQDVIATDAEVCYKNLDVASDCIIDEPGDVIMVSCKSGVTAIFGHSSADYSKFVIQCAQSNPPAVMKTWNVGTCTEKQILVLHRLCFNRVARVLHELRDGVVHGQQG